MCVSRVFVDDMRVESSDGGSVWCGDPLQRVRGGEDVDDGDGEMCIRSVQVY